MRNLGLLPKSVSDLHGFSMDELNRHFAGMSCSISENVREALDVVELTSTEGFF